MYYERVFKALYKHKVKYLIIGGMAVNLYGLPRFTKDLDICCEMSETNLLKLVKALRGIGYKPQLPVQPEELAIKRNRDKWQKEKHMVAFSFYNEKIPYEVVDILLDSKLDFNKIYKNRREMQGEGVKVPLVSISDLITLKKRASRKQDLSDLKALNMIKDI